VLQASYSPGRAENAISTIAPTFELRRAVTRCTRRRSASFVRRVRLNRRAVESLASQEEAQRFHSSNVPDARLELVAAAITGALKAQADAAEDIIRLCGLARAAARAARLGYASAWTSLAESALAQAELVLPQLKKRWSSHANSWPCWPETCRLRAAGTARFWRR